MPNNFLFVDWLTMESLRILVNKLVVAPMFNTDYNSEFTKEFAVGESVRVKLPQRFVIRDGIGYNPQGINRKNTTVSCNQIFGIDFDFDSVEQALKMERGEDAIRREYIEPAMAQIAQEIDSRAALWAYQNTNNVVGSLAANPNDLTTFNLARARMVQNACPAGNKCMIITPGMQVTAQAAFSTIFNPQKQIGRQWDIGTVSNALDFDWYESMSLYTHTAGTWQTPASVTVAGGGQSGSSLNINCITGDTFKVGDVFNIASVYNVNPSTRRSTGTLKQFVITQATVGANSIATLQIAPAIVGPGDQYQNVDSLPADTALLTEFPGTVTPSGLTGVNGLALHRDAFALIAVKLEVPKAVEMAAQHRDPKTGIAIRFIRQFDPIESKMVNRFDVLMGFGNLYADQCAVRVLGLN